MICYHTAHSFWLPRSIVFDGWLLSSSRRRDLSWRCADRGRPRTCLHDPAVWFMTDSFLSGGSKQLLFSAIRGSDSPSAAMCSAVCRLFLLSRSPNVSPQLFLTSYSFLYSRSGRSAGGIHSTAFISEEAVRFFSNRIHIFYRLRCSCRGGGWTPAEDMRWNCYRIFHTFLLTLGDFVGGAGKFSSRWWMLVTWYRCYLLNV